MKINPNLKSDTFETLSFWQKRCYKYSSAILLTLQILHFSSIAPEALFRLKEYLLAPKNDLMLEESADLVKIQNSGICDLN